MQRILALSAFALLLAGCNGGEDFSDATVPGCPAGAPCQETSSGDVLIELTGLQVDNLGYECVGTSVVFFTSDQEQTSTATDGSEKTVPPFNALCPAAATSARFFVGNGLFEGYKFILGEMEIPQAAPLEKYTITGADLVESPRRVPTSNPTVRNVAAFLQGLDSDLATPDIIEIPDEAHQLADEMEGVAPAGFSLANYDDFRDAWSQYFTDVSDAMTGSVVGMSTDPNIPLQEVVVANALTRAGNYRFDTCRGAFAAITCVSDINNDVVSVNFPERTAGDQATQEWPLILPTGEIRGLGRAIRQSSGSGSSASTTTRELVAFSEAAKVNDELLIENLQVMEVEPNGTVTAADASGKFLNKILYTGTLPDAAPSGSKTDVEQDYAGVTLDVNEQGGVSGQVLGGAVDLPLTAELFAAPQVAQDQDMVSDLAAMGPFTVRLMRACLDTDTGCRDIPNSDIEVAGDSADSPNYPATIDDFDITQELPREDRQGVSEFCLDITSNVGQADHGLVLVGEGGACPGVGVTSWPVGFVSRTFPDSESVNLTMLLVPGAENRDVSPNFGVTIQGRIDMGDASGCNPMYRTTDERFEAGLRTRWVDDFYPYVLEQEYREASSDGSLGAEQVAELIVKTSGAVEFFSGAAGGACDPAVP